MIDHSVYSSRVEPNPYKALFLKMEEHEKNYHRQIFLWISYYGTDGVPYGSFQSVTREFLETRDYVASFTSEGLSILMTDILLDPVVTRSRSPFETGINPRSEDIYLRRIEEWENNGRPI